MSESLVLRIHQGTGRSTGESLCRSCKYNMNWVDRVGEHNHCSMLGKDAQPMGNIYRCSAYYNANLPSLRAMCDTAWTLRTEKGGKMIGFAPPKQKKDEE